MAVIQVCLCYLQLLENFVCRRKIQFKVFESNLFLQEVNKEKQEEKGMKEEIKNNELGNVCRAQCFWRVRYVTVPVCYKAEHCGI